MINAGIGDTKNSVNSCLIACSAATQEACTCIISGGEHIDAATADATLIKLHQ